MNWQGKRVLVTGGAGLLGSYLVEDLVNQGAYVRVVDDLSTGDLTNLAAVRKDIEFHRASISDSYCSRGLILRSDVVFHLAAHMLVHRSVSDPKRDYEINMDASWHLLFSAKEAGIEKFVYASTCGVYGNSSPILAHKSEDTASPNNPYGAAKLAIEHFGQAYHECYDFPFVGVRLFSLLGPRMRQTVIYDLLERLRNDPSRLEVLGTGTVVRDFTPVKDAAYVMRRVAEVDDVEGCVFNYSGGYTYSILDVVGFILDILGLVGKTEVVTTGKSWNGDMDRLCSNNSAIYHALSDAPKVGEDKDEAFKAILREYMEWLSEEKGWPLFELKDKV